jgi:hypothetical protein
LFSSRFRAFFGKGVRKHQNKCFEKNVWPCYFFCLEQPTHHGVSGLLFIGTPWAYGYLSLCAQSSEQLSAQCWLAAAGSGTWHQWPVLELAACWQATDWKWKNPPMGQKGRPAKGRPKTQRRSVGLGRFLREIAFFACAYILSGVV